MEGLVRLTGRRFGTSKAETTGRSYCPGRCFVGSDDQYEVSLIYRVAAQSMIWCRVSVGALVARRRHS
jgi:hypothetical protein